MKSPCGRAKVCSGSVRNGEGAPPLSQVPRHWFQNDLWSFIIAPLSRRIATGCAISPTFQRHHQLQATFHVLIDTDNSHVNGNRHLSLALCRLFRYNRDREMAWRRKNLSSQSFGERLHGLITNNPFCAGSMLYPYPNDRYGVGFYLPTASVNPESREVFHAGPRVSQHL